MASITLKNLSKKSRVALASDTNLPKDGLYELAKDSDWLVLYHLCYNPITPNDIRIQLIKSNAPVTEYIAKTNTNKEILLFLKFNGDEKTNKIASDSLSNMQ